MSQATRAIEAMNEIIFDAQPGTGLQINVIYSALQKLKEHEEKAAAKSWEGAVDRQGGSFTPEEMDPMRGWR